MQIFKIGTKVIDNCKKTENSENIFLIKKEIDKTAKYGIIRSTNQIGNFITKKSIYHFDKKQQKAES